MKKQEKFHPNLDRSYFDWTLKGSAGWCQLDTAQDFSHCGHWVNPILLKFYTFVEGDLIIVQAESEEEFKQELTRVIDFYVRMDEFKCIDPMAVDKNEEALQRLGFGYALAGMYAA